MTQNHDEHPRRHHVRRGTGYDVVWRHYRIGSRLKCQFMTLHWQYSPVELHRSVTKWVILPDTSWHVMIWHNTSRSVVNLTPSTYQGSVNRSIGLAKEWRECVTVGTGKRTQRKTQNKSLYVTRYLRTNRKEGPQALRETLTEWQYVTSDVCCRVFISR